MFVIRIADDPNSFLPQHEFDDFETEPSKTVSVSDRNIRDASLQRSSKNGSKTFPVPIESRSNVCDNLPLWKLGPHVLDLSFKIILLSVRRHSTIADLRLLIRILNIPDAVTPLSTWLHDVFDAVIDRPLDDCLTGNSEILGCF